MESLQGKILAESSTWKFPLAFINCSMRLFSHKITLNLKWNCYKCNYHSLKWMWVRKSTYHKASHGIFDVCPFIHSTNQKLSSKKTISPKTFLIDWQFHRHVCRIRTSEKKPISNTNALTSTKMTQVNVCV